MSSSIIDLPWRNDFAQLGADFSTAVTPEALIAPRLVAWDEATAKRIGLVMEPAAAVEYFSGNSPLPGSSPVAMVYSGHQFGQFAGQLGDGRGLLLGDLKQENHYWDVHLKGAGQTPYSRSGDGRAVLRSCIREYLASIALEGLGIPTSHALCVLTGSERVAREQWEPRASLVRVATTHVRFGSFEHFYYNRQEQNLRRLADFIIERFLPDAAAQANRYEHLFAYAVRSTAQMIAHWQAVGFAHGVMNTDNMSIMGETFDYGPYGFMETYDPDFICNHSDHQGRYSFVAQPEIGFWNLQALAQSLTPLLTTDQLLNHLGRYRYLFSEFYAAAMRRKLALAENDPADRELVSSWLDLLAQGKQDYSRSFRALHNLDTPAGEQAFLDPFASVALGTQAEQWLHAYQQRLRQETQPLAQRRAQQQLANPLYVLRNYLAQQAITAATAGDYSQISRLADALRNPGTEQPDAEDLTLPAPAWAQDLAVSCSS